MKVLTRYFLTQFLTPFLLAIFGFSVIILIIQVFNDIHIILDNKPGFLLALKYFILLIPEFLIKVIPLAILFASLYSLSALSKNSELIAMKSGGVSIFYPALPLVLAGLIIFGFNIFLNEVVVPKTAKMVRHTKVVEIQKQAEPTAAQSRDNISMIGSGNQLYYVHRFDGQTATMNDVLILEFGPGNRQKSRLDAKSAKYEDGRWVFYSGYLRVFDDNGEEISAQPFDRLPLDLPEKPADFLKEQKQPQELNFIELAAYIRQLKLNGSDFHKELVELHSKVAFPFGCVVMAILGIPWGWTMSKYGGVVKSFGICLLVGLVGYMGGMQVGRTLGDLGSLSPFWSMWIVNILLGTTGVVLLVRNNR